MVTIKGAGIVFTLIALAGIYLGASLPVAGQQQQVQLPSTPLKFGAFVARFDPAGTFTLKGQGWPALNGNWKSAGAEIELSMIGGPGGCDGVGRYRTKTDGANLSFELVSDDCRVRQMILAGSNWVPAEQARIVPVRAIKRTAGARLVSSCPESNEEFKLAFVSWR